jgi:hypothetical protein
MIQQARARTDGMDVRAKMPTAARRPGRARVARMWFRAAMGLAGASLATLVASAMYAPLAEAATAAKVSCPHAKCSASLLQAAISKAASGSTIEVGAGTYRGDITIASSVTLKATGKVTLDGQNTAAKPGSVVTVKPSIVVTLRGFTITGGYAGAPWGGGIWNDGSLTLQHMAVEGNNGGTGEGGGIFSGGDLVITGSTITHNTSLNGGGIANYGDMVLSDSAVTGNTAENNGGGLDNANGIDATIISTKFSGNHAAGNGGAIDDFKMTLTIVDSTLSRNSAVAGGAVYGWTATTPASTVVMVGDTLSKNKPDNCAGSATC